MDDTEPFEDFYEEILDELAKFGEIEEMHVLENLGDHMFGNLYVKYHTEEEAEASLKAMTGRYYAGRLVAPEYSPVTDFREARCRQFDEATCNRGGYCNFMHLKYVARHLRRQVRDTRKKKKKKRSRSRDRKRRSSRSRSKGRSKSPGGEERNLARSDSAERRAKIAAWRSEPAPSAGGEEGKSAE